MVRIVVLLIVTFKAFALEVIPLTLSHTQNKSELNLSSPVGVPARSMATPGQVKSTKIDTKLFDNAIFVIGVDSRSKKWLFGHQRQLQSLNAIGFITNVDDVETIIELQEKSQLALLPVNVDPLLRLLGLNHYPFVISQGELWQ